MSIAQRSVASEGEAHPLESAALLAYQCDAINLPWVIFRAAFRANHIEQLPQRARAVLSALARTVDSSKPFAAIFARRELLTGRSMQSMRTFYRSLDDLEAAGLIDRRPQGRYVQAGLFGRAYIHLTAVAATLLGLVEPIDSRPTRESKTPVSPSINHPSATVADGVIYKDLSPKTFQKGQSGQVPKDLQRLRSLGFLDFLIFKLMREAREHGKRLSDVVEVTWQHLKAAQAPINYLRALLRNPIDFGHQLHKRIADQNEKQRLQENLAYAESVAVASAGQTFVNTATRLKYIVSEDGQSMVVMRAEEGVARQAAGWKTKFAEARESGRIRPATPEDLAAFEKHRVPLQNLTSQIATSVHIANERPKVTAQIRDHIAGLRSLLSQASLSKTTSMSR